MHIFTVRHESWKSSICQTSTPACDHGSRVCQRTSASGRLPGLRSDQSSRPAEFGQKNMVFIDVGDKYCVGRNFYFTMIINHSRYLPEEVRGFPVGRQRGRSSLWWLTHQESWGRTIAKGSQYLIIIFIIWGTAITKGSQNNQSLASS